MVNHAASYAINGINQNLNLLSVAASRITDPAQLADASDIVALKQAEAGMRVNAAVLKKVIDSSRLVDILA